MNIQKLKRAITRSNYQESFFQAVSNPSWAHEGYLAASEIKQDEDLLSELERLSTSFGIGIIHLELDDIDSSQVLFSAKIKSQMDWETMNKLSKQNPDFEGFIKNVKIDFDANYIHEGQYDGIISDPEKYIGEKKML